MPKLALKDIILYWIYFPAIFPFSLLNITHSITFFMFPSWEYIGVRLFRIIVKGHVRLFELEGELQSQRMLFICIWIFSSSWNPLKCASPDINRINRIYFTLIFSNNFCVFFGAFCLLYSWNWKQFLNSRHSWIFREKLSSS